MVIAAVVGSPLKAPTVDTDRKQGDNRKKQRNNETVIRVVVAVLLLLLLFLFVVLVCYRFRVSGYNNQLTSGSAAAASVVSRGRVGLLALGN